MLCFTGSFTNYSKIYRQPYVPLRQISIHAVLLPPAKFSSAKMRKTNRTPNSARERGIVVSGSHLLKEVLVETFCGTTKDV